MTQTSLADHKGRNRQSGLPHAESASSAPAGQFVEQAKRLVDLADELLKAAVVAERTRNTSWDEIGRALGNISKSAAHARFAADVKGWEATQAADKSRESDADVSYERLGEKWSAAAQIIKAQDLIAELQMFSAVAAEPRMPVGPARPSTEAAGASTLLGSVQRALKLLEVTASHKHGAPAKELAREAGLALPTAYHLLRTLVHEGYLRREKGMFFVDQAALHQLARTDREPAYTTDLEGRVARLESAVAVLQAKAEESGEP